MSECLERSENARTLSTILAIFVVRIHTCVCYVVSVIRLCGDLYAFVYTTVARFHTFIDGYMS